MNTNENPSTPSAPDEIPDLNPRLSYVLGESTEAERTTLETQILSDPTAHREIAELQHLAAATTLELRTAPTPNRSTHLRQSLEQRLNQTEVQPLPSSIVASQRRNRRRWLAFIAGTACVAGGVMFLSEVHTTRFAGRSRNVASVASNESNPDVQGNHSAELAMSDALTDDPSSKLAYDPPITTTTIISPEGSTPGGATSNGFGTINPPTFSPTSKGTPDSGKTAPASDHAAAYRIPAIQPKLTQTPDRLKNSESPSSNNTEEVAAEVRAGSEQIVTAVHGQRKLQAEVVQNTTREVAGTAKDSPHTRSTTVLNRLGLRPGDIIDIRKVRESEARLKATELFEQSEVVRDGDRRTIIQEEEKEALGLSNPTAEQYRPITDNPFRPTEGEQALSTFSVDVDTASYANVRRFLQNGQLPPPDAVRIEELLNYFSYHYPQPTGEHPFAVQMEFAACPWNDEHRLVRIGIKGKEIAKEKRPASNLVFLIDVSGSMTSDDKLPLLKKGLSLLVKELTEDDRVTIITYAGDAGEKLPTTNGTDKQKILQAIEALHAGGSTNGSAGIHLAYEKAKEHFIAGGTNRVLWATDGDLNVGVTGDAELVELVKEKAKSGVFVSVLGFGTGNLKDGKLEQIADNGNGIYAYIDSLREARKVLVEQMSGSLVTIAKDVKLQVEFNPAEVASYRLIGYENRVLATQDFHNDKKDAGDIGAGHTVTALYEIVPASKAAPQPEKKLELKYQKTITTQPEAKPSQTQPTSSAAESGELLTLKLRYKKPTEDHSQLLEMALKTNSQRFTVASSDFQFASAVASFGMILRGSPYRGTSTFDQIIETASATLSEDAGSYRAEFVDLVRRAKEIAK